VRISPPPGEDYNLNYLSDFAGNYTAASAGVAVGVGAGASYLKNEHGVVINWWRPTREFESIWPQAA
jgi:hypothetical protein